MNYSKTESQKQPNVEVLKLEQKNLLNSIDLILDLEGDDYSFTTTLYNVKKTGRIEFVEKIKEYKGGTKQDIFNILSEFEDVYKKLKTPYFNSYSIEIQKRSQE